MRGACQIAGTVVVGAMSHMRREGIESHYRIRFLLPGVHIPEFSQTNFRKPMF